MDAEVKGSPKVRGLQSRMVGPCPAREAELDPISSELQPELQCHYCCKRPAIPPKIGQYFKSAKR